MADKTKYQFFKEENRLTLVIDNPSVMTEELIKTLVGAEVHNMIGLNMKNRKHRRFLPNHRR